MIQVAVWFPLGAFCLAAIPRSRSLRILSRLLFAPASLATTGVALAALDGLSALFAATVSLLCALVVLFSSGIFPHATESGQAPWSRPPAFFMLLGAFWSSMLLAVTSSSFIGLWAGISATTLATTFLVAYLGGRAALEAAWKYLILCSFGIGIALVGTFFLGRAAMDAGISPADALSWAILTNHGAVLSSPLVRAGVLLMLVGFATKAGLVPMHAWLPDAHSKAPAPVSALLSGLLVSCALYAIMRVQSVTVHTYAATIFNQVLLAGGSLSVTIASLLMLAQRDVKRLLSYSTVEHAGLVALALGLATPLAIFVALYHVLNHGFGKSLAFLSVGVIQHERRTTSIGHLKGLWHSPSGRTFLLALVGLAGLPPFGLFVSELLLVIAAVQTRQWVVLAVVLVGLLVAFAALLRLAIETQTGQKPTTMEIAHASHGAPMRGFVASALFCVGIAAFAIALVPFSPLGGSLFHIATLLAGGS
jgi:hydrogenase-4 component F